MNCIYIHRDSWQFDCYNNVSIQVDLKCFINKSLVTMTIGSVLLE